MSKYSSVGQSLICVSGIVLRKRPNHQLQRNCQSPLARWNRSNRRFEFQERSQLLIRAHNETLSVAAMRINNPNRSPLRING